MDCQACKLELDTLLCNIPSVWRKQIVNVVCSHLEQPIDCSVIADCVSDELSTLDYKCLAGSQREWDALNMNGKLQKIIDKVCTIIGLAPFQILDTQSINLTGDGTFATPLSADLKISPDAGNTSVIRANGLYSTAMTVLAIQDTVTVDLAGSGAVGTPLTARVIIDPILGNSLVSNPTGLYVAPSITTVATQNTPTVQLAGDGTASTPLTGTVKVSAQPNNIVTIKPDGIFVPSVQASALVIQDTVSVDMSGNGTIGNPISASVILSPLSSNEITTTAQGLYSQKIDIAPSQCVTVNVTTVAGVKTFTSTIDWKCVAALVCPLCTASCQPVAFLTSPSLPNAVVGQPYSVVRSLGTSSGPFTLSVISKPVWMSIVISGANVQITNSQPITTTNVGTSIPISYTVTNACGNQGESTFINVIQPVACNLVGFQGGSVNLPPMTQGQAYNTIVQLTGDSPFTLLSGYTLPAGLTMTYVNNTYQIQGTPTGSGSFTVSFTITNCNGTGIVTHTQTMNIAPAPSCTNYTITNNTVNNVAYYYIPCGQTVAVTNLLLANDYIVVCAVTGEVITQADIVPGGACGSQPPPPPPPPPASSCISYTINNQGPVDGSYTYIACGEQVSETLPIPAGGTDIVCAVENSATASANVVILLGGSCTVPPPPPPAPAQYQFGNTELDTTSNNYTESQYSASVTTALTTVNSSTATYTSGSNITVDTFLNTLDKVCFLQVPDTEPAYSTWSEIGNPLQQDQPIDQTFAGTNVFFKTSLAGKTLYIARYQTSFVGDVVFKH